MQYEVAITLWVNTWRDSSVPDKVVRFYLTNEQAAQITAQDGVISKIEIQEIPGGVSSKRRE